ncbi:MAG TPA: NAD(P)-binding domain-containing protein [Polyangiaceae bacterium]|jgi:predicted dinucleotide-binding enzyme|nr:NAD(P)-binding domain-containing protein [Polyangiaceae bacterium]
MRKIAVIGSGVVGQVLADGCLQAGYEVVRASREPAKLQDWLKSAGPRASVSGVVEAAQQASSVVLAVKGTAAEDVVAACGEALTNKTVIDSTNPIADAPPTNGVLSFFTDLQGSLMERLQKRAPKANFVKAFSCVGSQFMVKPSFPGGRPTMFICGSNEHAKAEVTALLEEFGWDAEDLGAVEAARAIEPLCMLWCIPGLTGKGWSHAFKLLRI